MKTIDVTCPYCNAHPTEPCVTVRWTEVASGGGGLTGVSYGHQSSGRPAWVSRPHRERIIEARSTHENGS